MLSLHRTKKTAPVRAVLLQTPPVPSPRHDASSLSGPSIRSRASAIKSELTQATPQRNCLINRANAPSTAYIHPLPPPPLARDLTASLDLSLSVCTDCDCMVPEKLEASP